MSGPYLELQTLTWSKDTHGLFDYESNSLVKSTFKIKGPESLYRYNSECFLISEDIRPNSTPIIKIDQKLGEFTANLISDDPETAMWLVIKNIKSRHGNALRLREGDWVKLGRIRLKVQKISVRPLDTPFGLPPAYFLQNPPNDIEVKEEINDDNKENSLCRICLSETETLIDPLICPCKCSGTMKYIHLNCLKEWIKSKVSSRISEKGMTVYLKDLSCELCNFQLPTFINNKGQQISLINITFPTKSFIVFEEYKPDNSLVNGLHVVSLDPGQSGSIGRGHDSDIKVTDISVSRSHCQVKLVGSDFFLEDTKSKFGTLGRLHGQLLLRYGTEITVQINRTVLHFMYKEPWSFRKMCCCIGGTKVMNEPTSYFTQPDIHQSFQEQLSNRATMNAAIRDINNDSEPEL